MTHLAAGAGLGPRFGISFLTALLGHAVALASLSGVKAEAPNVSPETRLPVAVELLSGGSEPSSEQLRGASKQSTNFGGGVPGSVSAHGVATADEMERRESEANRVEGSIAPGQSAIEARAAFNDGFLLPSRTSSSFRLAPARRSLVPGHASTASARGTLPARGPASARGPGRLARLSAGRAGGSAAQRSRPARLLADQRPCQGIFPTGTDHDRGVVTVKLSVSAQGEPGAPRILSESPRGEGFDRATQICLPQLRFAPAQDAEGRPVASQSVLRLKFRR